MVSSLSIWCLSSIYNVSKHMMIFIFFLLTDDYTIFWRWWFRKYFCGDLMNSCNFQFRTYCRVADFILFHVPDLVYGSEMVPKSDQILILDTNSLVPNSKYVLLDKLTNLWIFRSILYEKWPIWLHHTDH